MPVNAGDERNCDERIRTRDAGYASSRSALLRSDIKTLNPTESPRLEILRVSVELYIRQIDTNYQRSADALGLNRSLSGNEFTLNHTRQIATAVSLNARKKRRSQCARFPDR